MTITEKIIKRLDDRIKNQLISGSDIMLLSDIINEIKDIDDSLTFDDISRTCIKFLSEKHHPHCVFIADSTGAQIFESIKSTGHIIDYLKD